MGKALVLQNVNFSSNKLATVTIVRDVRCTSIALSQSSISIGAGFSYTLVPTLAPSNTTDLVTWLSSNNNIAVVLDGVVTGVAAGTATITATCGSFSDTCTVTVT